MRVSPTAFPCMLLLAVPADAHVKWFSTIANCGDTPLRPFDVITGRYFIWLSLMAMLAMCVVAQADAWLARRTAGSPPQSLKDGVRPSAMTPPVVRLGVAAFFGIMPIYFIDAPIVLTPELKAHGQWLMFAQAAIAVLALARMSAWLAALGIVAVYAYAIALYGWFHLLDYVFFLGVAAFLWLDSRHGASKILLMLAVLRVDTALSFMWVGIEKWMYPGWTYEILRLQLQGLTMGLDPQFFIMAAGFVEFSLAFTMLTGRLSAQVAAGLLGMLMLAAIPLVGWIDAVGHILMLVVIGVLAVTRNPLRQAGPLRAGKAGYAGLYAFMLFGLVFCYFALHQLAYPVPQR